MPKNQNYGNQFFSAKNLLLYLVFAVVVYGLVYFFFMEGSFNKVLNYSQTYKTVPSKTVTVALASVNNSGESGKATLVESYGKTIVTLSLTGFKSGVSQPAHIHVGECPGVGAVKYPLNNIINGKSATTVDVTIARLKSEGPLAINVHKSDKEIKAYVSCGEI